jgi:hypothetical protein
MSFRKSLQRVRQYLKGGRPARRPRQSARPGLEGLEDRTVPTIVFKPQFGPITVSDGNGDVLNDVPIYLIFNGDYWRTAAGQTARGQVTGALTDLLNGPYLSRTDQYRWNLPGRPTFAGSTLDPNSLSDGFGFIGPNVGLSFQGVTIDYLRTGTLCGNVENVIDSGALPDADDVAHQPLYLMITAPGIQSHPGSPFSDNAPGGFHAWYPDPDNLVPVFLNPLDPFSPVVWVPTDVDNIMVGWVGTHLQSDGTFDIDQFTRVLSHEVLESVTDPGGGVPQFYPGQPHGAFTGSGGLLGGIGFNELADGEPDTGGSASTPYTYRLPAPSGAPNGVVVQPYWSRADQAFIVPDGNSQKFSLTPQYAGDRFLGTYALTVAGDQNADPTDAITLDTTAAGGVTVTLNGQTATFDPGKISSITVNPGGGTNTINIEHTLGGVPVTINEFGGNDIINLSPAAHSFGTAVQGAVFVTNAASLGYGSLGAVTTTVNAYDQNNPHADNYTVSAGGLSDAAGLGFTTDHAAALNLYGSAGGDDYEVQSTPAGAATSLFLSPSPANSVNVHATSGSLDVYSATGGPAGRVDTVNVGVGDPFHGVPGENLDVVTGMVTVHGNPSVTQVSLLDQNASFRGTYSVSATAVSRGLTGGGATPFGGLTYGGLNSLALDAEAGDATINVSGTAAGTATTLHAGTGSESISVGAGSLDAVAGPVTVQGNATYTVLSVDDSNDQGTRTYAIDPSAVSRGGTRLVSYSGVTTLALHGGAGADTVNVESPTAPSGTWVYAGYGTSTNVSPNSLTLDGIGHLTVEGGALTVNDQSPPNARVAPGGTTYTVDQHTMTRVATYLAAGPGPILSIPHVVTIDYYVSSLTLNAGPRHNTINVIGTSADTTIHGGPVRDAITVGPSLDQLGDLFQVRTGALAASGTLTVDARGGTLTLDDRASVDVHEDPSGDSYLDSVHTPILYTVGSDEVDRSSYVNQTLTYNNQPGDILPPLPRRTTVTESFSYRAAIHYSNVASLTLYGSPVPAGSVYTVSPAVVGQAVAVIGGGHDQLNGPNAITYWNLTGLNRGNLAQAANRAGSFTFSGVSDLRGNLAADVFQFGAGGGVSGLLDAGGTYNTLDYSQYATGVTVDLTGQNTPGDPSNPFGGLGLATGTAHVRHILNVVGTRFNDTLIGDDEGNVFSPDGGLDVVRGNGGDDTFRTWGPQDPGTILDGGGGTNTFWAADFPNVWNVTGPGAGRVLGTIPGYVSGASFSNVQNLLGGTNTDRFQFADGAGVTGWVNGNLGVNTLDYSAYTTPVTVNLSAYGSWGSAMNARGGVMNSQIVIGSRTAVDTLTGSNLAASVLVGGAAADVLTAGAARCVLIGGQGADALRGGPADDLMIGGSTAFDTNAAALAQVLAEWQSADSFADRVNYLSGAVVAPGHYGGPVLGLTGANPTVFDDGSTDTTSDPGGMNWIIPS